MILSLFTNWQKHWRSLITSWWGLFPPSLVYFRTSVSLRNRGKGVFVLCGGIKLNEFCRPVLYSTTWMSVNGLLSFFVSTAVCSSSERDKQHIEWRAATWACASLDVWWVDVVVVGDHRWSSVMELFALYKHARHSLPCQCGRISVEEKLTTHANPSVRHLLFRHLGCELKQLYGSSPFWALCRWWQQRYQERDDPRYEGVGGLRRGRLSLLWGMLRGVWGFRVCVAQPHRPSR